MPKVSVVTKSSRETKSPYTCTHCGKCIETGQKYYQWQLRFGPMRRRHVMCGYPMPSELSSAKTAAVLDAVRNAGDVIASWYPEMVWIDGAWTLDVGVEDVQIALDDVASEAESVADEYEDSADNMPENLQYGTQAEAMRDVAERLRDFASEVTDALSSVDDEPDWPEGNDETAAQEALDKWTDEVRSAAEEKLSDVPVYEA